MTWYKRGIVDDHLAAEDDDDLVYPADVDAPGINKDCR